MHHCCDSSVDNGIKKLQAENAALREQLKEAEKVIEERGYAFQNKVQEVLSENQALKARLGKLEVAYEKGFSEAIEKAATLMACNPLNQDGVHKVRMCAKCCRAITIRALRPESGGK